MATIRKHYKSWQVIIRKQGHPHVYKSFKSYSDAINYAEESEANIRKGLFVDMSEANQTTLRDTLVRYKDEVTTSKKGARQEASKINKLMRHKICNCSQLIRSQFRSLFVFKFFLNILRVTFGHSFSFVMIQVFFTKS